MSGRDLVPCSRLQEPAPVPPGRDSTTILPQAWDADLPLRTKDWMQARMWGLGVGWGHSCGVHMP